MDQSTQERLDAILEEEIARGFRIKDVPARIQAMLKADGLAVIPRVKFSRMNPRRRAKMGEAIQRRYHSDLKNPDILSNDQIAKLVADRGEWTTEHSTRMFDLQEDVKKLQGELYLDGVGEANWEAELMETVALLRGEITKAEFADEGEQEKTLRILDRWVEYLPENRSSYTILYAAEQELVDYSPDRDLAFLMERCPNEESLDALHLIDDLRLKVIDYQRLVRKRIDLAVLQAKHARIFADSVESRRDAAEEMARLFFVSEVVDAKDMPVGPLCESFEGMWDFPETFIKWLVIEQYFFANGMPDEARDYLETFNFLEADRMPRETTPTTAGDSTPSVVSPDPQSSRGGLPPVAVTVPGSSA